MNDKRDKDILDESLRRLGGILASPALVTSYEHTTPLLERAWLRRMGLSKAEAKRFLSIMCEKGLLDTGAKAVVYGLCQKLRLRPEAAARLLLQGEGWPEQGMEDV